MPRAGPRSRFLFFTSLLQVIYNWRHSHRSARNHMEGLMHARKGKTASVFAAEGSVAPKPTSGAGKRWRKVFRLSLLLLWCLALPSHRLLAQFLNFG